MERLKHLFWICSGIVFFLSCASSSTKFIRPEYRTMSNKNAQLLIAPIEEVAFNVSDEIMSDLNITSTKQEHEDFFKSNLVKQLKSQINGPVLLASAYPEEQAFSKKKLTVNKRMIIKLEIPDSTEWINYDVFKDGYILFLQGIHFSISKTDKDSSRPEKFYNLSGDGYKDTAFHPLKYFKYNVHYSAQYALMDRSMHKFVSYGNFDIKKSLKEKEEIEMVIQNCIQKGAEEILDGTPLTN